MNNEDLSIRHTERQNQVIDTLLKENAYLKGFINRYILLNMGINEAEKELLQVMIGNNEMENSGYQPEPGNIEMDISTHQPIVGNNEMSISNGHATPGNKEIKISNDYLIPGIDELKLAEVINRVTLLMRSASKKAILNTAKLLFQWQANPATSNNALCRLTGMSKDGMAKRIMAMKKAGLIVRYSAPLRYVLTEKARALLAEKAK